MGGRLSLTSVLVNGSRWVIMATISMALLCVLEIFLRMLASLTSAPWAQLIALWSTAYPALHDGIIRRIRMILLWHITSGTTTWPYINQRASLWPLTIILRYC
ncbi:hypothetical protein F5J12DRAFT_867995 [Pisolithus orientalis]|uniref:uncharacterized protein n=1 Tax=Pisolithus orientalis TaxID=936130 RepID=UPI002224D857|nr:uncharacterized protein F5J12DRAFT_867995 [Pisolithus orientalis]KAI5986979.1 hypothetical protein F5J12DRAFT_867995 [Pisolithus orientalis]